METISAATTQQPVRALSVGSVLSRTFSLIRRKIGLFLSIALIPGIVSALIGLFTLNSTLARLQAMQSGDLEAASQFSWGTTIISLVPFVLYFVIQGAFSYAVFQQLTNRPATLGQSLVKGLKRFPYLLVTGIVSILLMYLGFLLLIIPGIIVACFICVTMPVCAVEQKGPFASIGRSYRLTKGNWLRILGLSIIAAVIIAGATMLAALPLLWMVQNMALSGESISTGFLILAIVSNLLAGLIMSIFVNVLIAVLYFELRSSKENVALENLANVFA